MEYSTLALHIQFNDSNTHLMIHHVTSRTNLSQNMTSAAQTVPLNVWLSG